MAESPALSAAQGPLLPPLSVISDAGGCIHLFGSSRGGDADDTSPDSAAASSAEPAVESEAGTGRGGGGEGEGRDEFQRLNDSCALQVFSFLTVPIHRAACAQVRNTSCLWFFQQWTVATVHSSSSTLQC